MEIDKYGIYKNKIQELFDETCISLKELDDCHNGKEQLHDAEIKIRNLFNELDFISARACSLYDTDEHEVGKWFADSSKDAFSALVVFCRVSKKSEPDNAYLPSEKAFSSMQRLISLYLPKEQVDEISRELAKSNIPTVGFKEKVKFRMTKSTEKLISYFSCTILLVSIFIIALLIPYPSQFQYTIFRIIISLAAGGIAAFFTGFLTVEWSNKIKAGNGFGVFIVVYLIAPAAMEMN